MYEAIAGAILSPVAIAFVAWLFRKPLGAFAARWMSHEFDRRLTALESELQARREADADRRGNPLAARLQRQGIIDQRRLAAIDQIWAAVQTLGVLKSQVTYASMLRWPEIAEVAKNNPEAREMFKTLSGRVEDIPSHEGFSARPFVSEKAWALFAAYQTLLHSGFAHMKVLETGVGAEGYEALRPIDDILVAALPEWEERIRRGDLIVRGLLMPELEEKLLLELRRNLEGEEDDAREVERAALIIRMVQEASRDAVAAEVPDLQAR